MSSSLSAWHASPLTPMEATRLCHQARHRAQQAYRRGRRCFGCQIDQLIARFWQDKPIEAQFRVLLSAATNPSEQALVELVYGQLLMSRRLKGARQHLEAGFELALNAIPAQDFFPLLQRIETLGQIPLRPIPSAPSSLEDLLNEARVIRRLRGSAGRLRRFSHNPRDTVG